MKYTAPEMNIILFNTVDYIVASVNIQDKEDEDEGDIIPGGEEE